MEDMRNEGCASSLEYTLKKWSTPFTNNYVDLPLLYGTRMDTKVTVGISASLLNTSLWESDARKNIQDPFSSS